MDRNMLDKYPPLLTKYGQNGVGRLEFLIDREKKNSLQYIPFEYVNPKAKLALVGISPGPNQLELAYETAQAMIKAGKTRQQTLVEIKKHGAFGGDRMRPNLVKMLNYFGFDRILGVSDINSLWGSQAHLLHSTSVVPHAAFTRKKIKGVEKDTPFAGDFEEVWGCNIFRECFLDCFVPSLAELNPNTLFVGLGKCPEQALDWCVEHGHIRADQVLGAISHPSTAGGSSVAYFLREKRREDLSPNDPVRHRCDWLDSAYERMTSVTEVMLKQVA